MFLYLPIPYWAASVVFLYRHDLRRLFHPVRDDDSASNWESVLSYLGLLNGQKMSGQTRKREVLPYIYYGFVSTSCSFLWILRVFPAVWYYLVFDQLLSSIVLSLAIVQYLGPPPRRPYVDVLRYPRLGSRIRHLRKIPSLKRMDKSSEQEPAK